MAFKRSGVRIPLAPPQKYHTFCMVFFVYFQGDCANLEKFVPRRCRANPCGLTLRNVNKFTFFAITEASESLPTNPLGSTTKIPYILYGIFVYFQGDCANLEKFVPRRCRANPCGLITNEERRKRVAFADIECSFIANKSDTKCPRKAQCNARFVERRRSEK